MSAWSRVLVFSWLFQSSFRVLIWLNVAQAEQRGRIFLHDKMWLISDSFWKFCLQWKLFMHSVTQNFMVIFVISTCKAPKCLKFEQVDQRDSFWSHTFIGFRSAIFSKFFFPNKSENWTMFFQLDTIFDRF